MKKQSGFTLLITILVVGSVALSIGVSLLFLSIKSMQNVEVFESKSIAKYTANACIEDALKQIQRTGGSVSSGNYTVGGNICTYTVANLGGENRRIEATSTIKRSSALVTVQISAFTNEIIITSWAQS